MISVTVPIRTVSEANSHQHWRARQKRAKEQRRIAMLMVTAAFLRHGFFRGPQIVTITRLSPRSLDDDNLASSQKHVRDGVADALGIDDRDPRVTWQYAQERGKPNEYAVRVEIARRAEP